MLRLPLVASHAKEHTYCAYCPKMCRFSCPVSTVQGRESTTPWGKMTSLHHVARSALSMSASVASTWYACTGCMRCRTYCAHGNEVGPTLLTARAEAVRAGFAPEAANDVIARHAERRDRAAESIRTHLGGRLEKRSAVALVPGCTACATAPADVKLVLGALDKTFGCEVGLHAADCCGLPLLDAGDHAGGIRALEAFAAKLRGVTTAVFQDPGCLYALKILGGEYGIRVDAELVHVTETLARALQHVRPLRAEGKVRYHDACRLGRGLGVYDAPRELLGRLIGRPPDEFPQRREYTECVGSGGQLPRTDRASADAIARDRAADHVELGGGAVVTACPSARRRWATAGVQAHDLSVFAARAWNGSDG